MDIEKIMQFILETQAKHEASIQQADERFARFREQTRSASAVWWMSPCPWLTTFGFVSMMILGVSSRVVPILAGVDSKQLTSLWGPFILLNAGCAGRVLLQILTDFAPRIA